MNDELLNIPIEVRLRKKDYDYVFAKLNDKPRLEFLKKKGYKVVKEARIMLVAEDE